jgi:hypothetical protein
MRFKTILEPWGSGGGWTRELILAVVTLAVGFGVMPILIFFAGSSALGRYDGASVAGVYDGVYRGLGFGSLASWVVVLGPYSLYLIFKALRLWWRGSARLA